MSDINQVKPNQKCVKRQLTYTFDTKTRVHAGFGLTFSIPSKDNNSSIPSPNFSGTTVGGSIFWGITLK